MSRQPELEPLFDLNAVEVAAEMQTRYGDDAIVGAMAALRFAEHAGHQPSVDLWTAVCETLQRSLVISYTLH